MASALVVGEALVDIVTHPDGSSEEHPGGSPANVAVALSRLGREARLATGYADDAHGALLSAHLADAGVALAGDPFVLEHTSTAAATLDASGSARYVFDLDWAFNVPELGDAVVLHTGSLATVLAPGAEVIADLVEARREAVTVSFDLNARPAATGSGPEVVARVERLIGLADVVKASDEDLLATWPGLDVEGGAQRVRDLGATAVVVTEGAAGAFALTPRGRVQVPAESVTVADTIGAGDSFCAALLDGLWGAGVLGGERRTAFADLDLESWTAVLRRCARAAAIAVSRPGADPATRAELDV